MINAKNTNQIMQQFKTKGYVKKAYATLPVSNL